MPMEADSPSLFTWLVGGLGALVCYLLISNTLYLLIGARLLQCLPGVNVRGFTGTVRLAFLLFLSFVGFAVWSLRTAGRKLHLPIAKTSLGDEIGRFIRLAARTIGQKSPLQTEPNLTKEPTRS